MKPEARSRKPDARVSAALLRGTLCVALCGAVACVGMGKKPPRPALQNWPEIRSDFSAEALKLRMQEYTVTFAAEVDLAAMSIERRATDPAVRLNALQWRLRAVPEMRKACFRPEPLAALVDAWTLARQMDQLFTTGAGRAIFGAFQPEAVNTSQRLVARIREIADSIAVSTQAREQLERNVIDPWLATHPLPDVTFVRDSPIAQFAEQARARGDVFQSVGSMEELMIGLSQQARIYLADLPKQVRGEIDLLRAELLPPETITGLQTDLHLAAVASDRLAATAEGIPGLVSAERKVVLDDVGRQRALLMEALSVERERATGEMIRALAAERAMILREFEAQRLATLEWATAERLETIATMRQESVAAIGALRGERAAVIDDVRGIVDGVLLRLGLFLVAAVLLAPLVAHAYVRVWPRRRP